MSKQHALQEIEAFSAEEAVTVARGDRPTLRFAIPRDLMELAESQESVETKVQLLSDILHGPVEHAPVEHAPVEHGAVEPAADGHEKEFWDSSPRYSPTTVRPLLAASSLPPPVRRPTRLRRALSKVLFTALFSGVLALLAYEASTVYGVHWSDVRGLLAKVG